MIWWFVQARQASFSETWTLFSAYNIGTVLIQWAIVLVVVLLANRWLVERTMSTERPREGA